MKFINRIRERLCINSLNDTCMNSELRELKPIVLDLVKCIPNLKCYGYRNISMDPVQDFKLTNVDYLHKTKNREDVYVSMADDVVENVEVYCVLNEDLISVNGLKAARSLTKRYVSCIPKLDYVDEDLHNEIMTYEEGYMSCDEDDYDGSLFIVFNLYIPRLINNVIRLNGNPYFNKYYIQEGATLTRLGKLKCQHSIYVSYMSIDKSTETFRTHIFDNDFNSFVFVRNLSAVDEDYINDILDNIPEAKREYYRRVINNTLQQAQLFKSGEGTAEEVESYESVKDNITSSDILESVKNFILVTEIGSQDFSMSLHNSLRIKFLRDMKKSLKLSAKKTKKLSPSKIKSKINVDPRTVCTIIKNSNQYSLDKSANEVDTYHFFGYVSNLDADDTNIATNRKFERTSLGLIDPIGSSASSENIGLTGMLVFTIPDKYLVSKK